MHTPIHPVHSFFIALVIFQLLTNRNLEHVHLQALMLAVVQNLQRPSMLLVTHRKLGHADLNVCCYFLFVADLHRVPFQVVESLLVEHVPLNCVIIIDILVQAVGSEGFKEEHVKSPAECDQRFVSQADHLAVVALAKPLLYLSDARVLGSGNKD